MAKSNDRNQLLKRVSRPDLPRRKSEQTREAILEAALDFLWTQPFRELTVSELMSRTGNSRAVFYQYFQDLHHLMEVLLVGLEQEIFEVAAPFFHQEGDPLSSLRESLRGLVKICYRRGPILRAVVEAAPSDERLEKSWQRLMRDFDDAVAASISEQQTRGIIPAFDSKMVALTLNRMDAALLVEAFGRRPRRQEEPVFESIYLIWSSTLYPDLIR